jgi:hypothetical protein
VGQPGKIKIIGYLERGSMGVYSDTVALVAATGLPRQHLRRSLPLAILEDNSNKEGGLLLQASVRLSGPESSVRTP